MHTATRLAAPLIARAGRVNASARLAAYGFYAPLNASWLGEQGVTVLGPDAEAQLAELAQNAETSAQGPASRVEAKARRAAVHRPIASACHRWLGTRRCRCLTEAAARRRIDRRDTRMQAPLPPLSDRAGLRRTFRAIPIDVVMDDVRAQVAAGAEHISFGDPDFFNGPTHARRIVEAVAKEFPRLTYDVTIKIEHILRHVDMLGLLRDTGCLMITSAVESVDDEVLVKLRKGHTRADFIDAVGFASRRA